MPRKEIKYYCNICQTEYCNERDAANCEDSHFIPEYVDCPNYSKFDGKKMYPYSILVHFKGGETARYYRKENY